MLKKTQEHEIIKPSPWGKLKKLFFKQISKGINIEKTQFIILLSKIV
jgi:hypothetical protein